MQSGSLTKAAAQLRVSHPAVSQVIADLEHALGVKLFDRSSRGVEPTLYARALLARGRAAFDELRQGIRDIEFLADPTAGELDDWISAVDSGPRILPQMIERFSEKYPRVVMQREHRAVPCLQIRRDCAIEPTILSWREFQRRFRTTIAVNDLNVEVLFDDPWVIVACTNSRWARRRKVDLAELIDEPWIMPPPDTLALHACSGGFQSARSWQCPTATLVTYSMDLRVKLSARWPVRHGRPEVRTAPSTTIDTR